MSLSFILKTDIFNYFVFFFMLSGCSSLSLKTPFKSPLKSPLKKQEVFKVSWIKNLDSHYESGNLAIGLGAPRIFNDIVYMGSLDGVMFAYDIETGRTLWKKNEKTPLGAPVILVDDHVFYGGQSGRMFARHYLTGKLKYAIDLGGPIESAPFYHEGRLYIYLRGHQIVALDPISGKILWAFKRSVAITTTLQRTTKPLILDGKMIVGFADGYVGALSLNEGMLLWETKIAEQGKFVDVDLNPIKVGKLIITGSPSGELKAIDQQTGAIVKNFNIVVEAHPVLHQNKLVLGTSEGEVQVLSPEGEVFKKVKVSQKPISALSIWKNQIVASSFDGKIYFLKWEDLSKLDEFALGNDTSVVYSDLVTSKEHLAVYSSRNRLYLFR